MRVLLVGGNGFIGSHLKDAILSRGFEVSSLDRLTELYRPSMKKVQFMLGDLSDPDLADRSLNDVEVVIYCASATTPQMSANDPEGDVTKNLIPFLRFIKLAGEKGVKRIIFLSSGGMVYGVTHKSLISEEHPTNPIGSQGILKLAMEKYLLALARTNNMEVVILRLGNVYGERQYPFGQFGAIGTFLGCVAIKQDIKLWGDGSIVRDYIYVKDVATACLNAAILENIKGVYNIGTARGYSLNEVLEVISDTIDQSMPIIHRTAKRDFDIPAIVLDNKLARKKLLWKPTVSLFDGIKSTWDWIREISSAREQRLIS